MCHKSWSDLINQGIPVKVHCTIGKNSVTLMSLIYLYLELSVIEFEVRRLREDLWGLFNSRTVTNSWRVCSLRSEILREIQVI